MSDVHELAGNEWATGDAAARDLVAGAVADVADLVDGTLGPAGTVAQVETQDRQGEREVVVSGDAGAIFDAVERGGGFTHPVAALFVDAVDAMTRAHGDGTARAALLGAALVEEGLGRVEDGVSPTTLTVGYAMAAARVGEVFDALALPASDRETREAVARTALTSLDGERAKDRYAGVVADAVERLAARDDRPVPNADDVRVIATTSGPTGYYRGVVTRRYATGPEADPDVPAEFDPGPLLDDAVADATVAVVDDELDFEETATSLGGDGDAGVVVESPDEASAYASALDERRAAFARRLADLGVDVLVSQVDVEDALEIALDRHGVHVADEVETPKSDVHRIARATGATVVSHPDDVTADRLGVAGRVAEHEVDGEVWTVFDECAGGPSALVVAADTDAACDRLEAALDTALEAVTTAAADDQVLPGGGAAEMAAATALRADARGVAGNEQLAMEAFADALERVPVTLARNAGRDHVAALASLRQEHAADGHAVVGLDATGECVDAVDAGVLDPRRTASQAVETARAVAEQLLAVDDVLHPGVDLDRFRPRTER